MDGGSDSSLSAKFESSSAATIIVLAFGVSLATIAAASGLVVAGVGGVVGTGGVGEAAAVGMNGSVHTAL